MPSFGDVLDPELAWPIVYYARSIWTGEAFGGVEGGEQIEETEEENEEELHEEEQEEEEQEEEHADESEEGPPGNTEAGR